jgi:hypothetical protein
VRGSVGHMVMLGREGAYCTTPSFDIFQRCFEVAGAHPYEGTKANRPRNSAHGLAKSGHMQYIPDLDGLGVFLRLVSRDSSSIQNREVCLRLLVLVQWASKWKLGTERTGWVEGRPKCRKTENDKGHPDVGLLKERPKAELLEKGRATDWWWCVYGGV